MLKEIEKKVLKLKEKRPEMFRNVFSISISGFAGSGKSFHAKHLAKRLRRLGYRVSIIEAGSIFKEEAKKTGIKIIELHNFSKEVRKKGKNEIDEKIDERSLLACLGFKKIVGNSDIVILVGRLTNLVTYPFSHIRIFLFVELEKNIERIKKDRKRVESKLTKKEIARIIRRRNEEDLKRFKKFYKIKNPLLELMKASDLIVNNSIDFRLASNFIYFNVLKKLNSKLLTKIVKRKI